MCPQPLEYERPSPPQPRRPSNGPLLAALVMGIIGLIVLLDERLWRLTLVLWIVAVVTVTFYVPRARR